MRFRRRALLYIDNVQTSHDPSSRRPELSAFTLIAPTQRHQWVWTPNDLLLQSVQRTERSRHTVLNPKHHLQSKVTWNRRSGNYPEFPMVIAN